MKYIISALFITAASTANAAEAIPCLDKARIVETTELLVAKGYDQDGIYDMFQSLPPGGVPRGVQLRLIAEVMGWVFVVKKTSKEYIKLCADE